MALQYVMLAWGHAGRGLRHKGHAAQWPLGDATLTRRTVRRQSLGLRLQARFGSAPGATGVAAGAAGRPAAPRFTGTFAPHIVRRQAGRGVASTATLG